MVALMTNTSNVWALLAVLTGKTIVIGPWLMMKLCINDDNDESPVAAELFSN